MITTAIDISQYSGEVTEQAFRRAKVAGVRRVIVALNNLPVAQRQLAAATAAGMEVEAYIYLYFSRDIDARVKSALEAVRGSEVKRIWLDAEDATSGVTTGSILNGLRKAERLVTAAGYKAGIYTAGWYWRQHAGNSPDFRHLPLWDAYWDRNPDIDHVTYGGWTVPEMSQHTADTHFAGIWCDINSYRVTRGDLTLEEFVELFNEADDRGQRWNRYSGTRDLENGYVEHDFVITKRERIW